MSESSQPIKESSQFALLKQRRFAGLFYTQFLGAFNDNVFKAALSLIFVYGGLIAADTTDIIVNIAAGLFILPFFLFSATAGQIADKFEKSRLVRIIKVWEIAIALMGGIAVYMQNVPAMLGVLFLLGVQSTFFGPLKFSILPQQLDETELIGGNAQIEMGTFVAILLGTLLGGIVAAQTDVNLWLTVMVVGVAVVGYVASRFIPNCPATEPRLRIGWNPFTETWRMVQNARSNHAVYLSILGISWFWLLGSVFLTQIPNLANQVLSGGTTVVTLILAVFTVSVAVGSLACERLSGHKIELGLVPVGALGLGIAGLDLYFALGAVEASQPREWLDYLKGSNTIRPLVDFGLFGFFGGLFIVPLYALIQTRTPENRRARIIAVNNVMNALFMVVGTGFALLLLGVAEMSIPDFLLTVMLMNIAVCIFIFHQVPEFAMRFLVWVLSHTTYRVSHQNLQLIPESGAAAIVCNHVTYVDALLLAGAVRRPIRFIMYKPIYDIPVLNFVFRAGGAIPIEAEKVDKEAHDRAFSDVKDALDQGDLVCIFPEGALTRDGDIAHFRRGIDRIIEASPVPVVPMALKGLWGSYFSHSGGVFRNPSRFWSKVCVVAGAPIAPDEASVASLHDRVSALRGELA